MEQAIIGLIGVLMGGIIAVAGQIILSVFESKRWKKEKHIEYLRIQKEDLEKKYDTFIPELYKAINSEFIDTKMAFEIMYTFPKEVSDAFSKLMKMKTDRQPEKEIRQELFKVISEMKKALSKIDQDIKTEIEK